MLRNFKHIIYILIVLSYIFNASYSQINNNSNNNNNKSNNDNNKNKPILKYNKDNKFKIIQFTDLHYGNGEDKDLLNYNAQETIIEAEKPDYIILSGDIISGRKYHTVNQYLNVWKLLSEPMIKRGIPWSITFGNHDCEGLLNCKEIADIDMSYSLSLTQINSDYELAGLANYILNIFPIDYEPTDNSSKNSSINNSNSYSDSINAKSLIYIFDSNTVGCSNNDFYGCIQTSQVEWYKNISNSLNKKEAISFVHVPPYEIIKVWNDGTTIGEFEDSEVCCYYTKESRFIDTIVEQGDIKGLYFGHDHRNDFHGNYNGLDLGYGRKAGFGSYTPHNNQGARVFELTAEPFKIDTWIRDYKGNKDLQKTHKPRYFDRYQIICCQPGDIRSKPWFSVLISSISVGFALITVSILIKMFISIYKKRKSNINQQQNQQIKYNDSKVYNQVPMDVLDSEKVE